MDSMRVDVPILVGMHMCICVNMWCMQSNAVLAENGALRSQIQEHQAHAAALQDQSAEQSRTISLGSLQLKQLQSKVRFNWDHSVLDLHLQALPHVLLHT